MKSPYQEFKFDRVTAKYLKVKLLSDFANDGYITAAEFQLFGDPAAAATSTAAPASAPATAATAAAPAKPRTNLLARASGGELLAAPQDLWNALNDGKEDYVSWLHPDEEGVFGFKDGKAATFDTFAIFIGGANPANVKEFELLVGDDSPTGTFRSIGTFTTQNLKLMKSPYQEFKFDPVTAKYLKVKLLSDFAKDGYITAAEFQLYGETK
jgi:hypothetical protein